MPSSKELTPLELIIAATAAAGGRLPDSLILEAEAGLLAPEDAEAVRRAAPEQLASLKAVADRVWRRAASRACAPVEPSGTLLGSIGLPERSAVDQLRPLVTVGPRAEVTCARSGAKSAEGPGSEVILEIGSEPHQVHLAFRENEEAPSHYDIDACRAPAAALELTFEKFGQLAPLHKLSLRRRPGGHRAARLRGVPPGMYSVRILFADDLVWSESMEFRSSF